MDKKKQSDKDSFDLNEDDIMDILDGILDEGITDLADSSEPAPSSSDKGKTGNDEELLVLDDFEKDAARDDDDDVLDLTDSLLEEDDDILDLEEPAAPNNTETLEFSGLDDATEENLEVEPIDDDDDVIDLAESADDEILDLVDVQADVDDDIIELADKADEIDDDILDLDSPVTLSMDDAVDTQAESDDDILELEEELTHALGEEDEDILELSDEADDVAGAEEPVTETLDEVNITASDLIAEDDDEILTLDEPATEVLDEEDDEILDLEDMIEDHDDMDDLGEPQVISDNTIDLTEMMDKEPDDDIIDLKEQMEDDDVLIDLDEPVTISGDTIDLEEVAEADSSEDIIDLEESMEDDDILIDLDEPVTISGDTIDLTEVAEADSDEDIIDLDDIMIDDDGDAEGIDETLDLDEITGQKTDDEFVEVELSRPVDGVEPDMSEPVEQSAGFDNFAEQTTNNLNFDLSDSLTTEGSKITILNTESMKSGLGFDSFAEQTTDHLSLKPGELAAKSSVPLTGSKDAEDIADEISNFTLEDEEACGHFEQTVEMDTRPSLEDTDILNLEDTLGEEILDLSEIAPSGTGESGVEDLDITWDNRNEKFSETMEEALETDVLLSRPIDPVPVSSMGMEITPEPGISREELDLAVERVIRKLYGEKIDAMILDVIGKVVSSDIERLKGVLSGETGDKK